MHGVKYQNFSHFLYQHQLSNKVISLAAGLGLNGYDLVVHIKQTHDTIHLHMHTYFSYGSFNDHGSAIRFHVR